MRTKQVKYTINDSMKLSKEEVAFIDGLLHRNKPPVNLRLEDAIRIDDIYTRTIGEHVDRRSNLSALWRLQKAQYKGGRMREPYCQLVVLSWLSDLNRDRPSMSEAEAAKFFLNEMTTRREANLVTAAAYRKY